jgi:hypothetical protein
VLDVACSHLAKWVATDGGMGGWVKLGLFWYTCWESIMATENDRFTFIYYQYLWMMFMDFPDQLVIFRLKNKQGLLYKFWVPGWE